MGTNLQTLRLPLQPFLAIFPSLPTLRSHWSPGSQSVPSASRCWRMKPTGPVSPQKRVDLAHHFERVRHVKHVGFSARPTAIRIEVHRAALADESPAHGMWFFPVTAGREALEMPRRRAGLADRESTRL